MDKVQTLIKINNQAYSIQISECCEFVEIVLTNIVTKTSYCCSLDEPNIRNITLTGGFIRTPRQFTGLLNLGAKNQEENGKIKLTGKIDIDDNTLLLSLTVKLDVEDMSDSILYVIPMKMVEKKDINRMEEMMLDFCNSYTSDIDEKQIKEMKRTLQQLKDSQDKDKQELLSSIKQLEDLINDVDTEFDVSYADTINVLKKSISDNETELKTLLTTVKAELLQKITEEGNTSKKERNAVKEELQASMTNTKTELTQILTNNKNELTVSITANNTQATTALSNTKVELTNMVNSVKTELAQLVADTKAELVKMINDNKPPVVVP
jgi:hypothetical protein